MTDSTVQPIAVALLGASGRMGQQVERLMEAAPEHWALHGRWQRGASLGDVLSGADVAIDFTVAEASGEIVEGFRDSACALVTGTTGREAEQQRAIEALAQSRPVFVASNMSPAVHLLNQLVARTAAALAEFDIEIAEAHHSGKADAPSGTALRLGEFAASARGVAEPDPQPRGDGLRESGGIGYSVQRGGSVIGDHRVSFFGQHEMLTLEHRALDRSMFAAGALRAARWLVGRSAGLYGMNDLVNS